MTIMENVKYGEHEMQAVDFYWPDAEEPEDGWPVVAGFHGINQDKSGFHGFCKKTIIESQFTRACMAVNYRDKGHKWDAKATDAKNSIKWLVNNAGSYKVNNRSIILYGFSLGGFLANIIVWTLPDLTSKHVSAAIFCSGVHKSHVRMASGSHPPLLVISSEDDKVVKYENSKDLFDKLTELDGTVHLLTYLDAGHNPRAQPSFYSQIEAFLDNPSTYEAPDPLTLTTTPVPLSCKGLCNRNQKEWSLKCSWPECGACGECETTTTTTTTRADTCLRWCRKHTEVWEKKCTFKPDCVACPECRPVSETCPGWCARNTKTWEEKCEWSDCSACDNCQTPVASCQGWCARHTKTWEEKCEWSDCSSCDTCEHIR